MKKLSLIGSLVAVAVMCAPAWAQSPGGVAVFSHHEHLLRERELKCTDCHDPDHARPELKTAGCVKCHEPGQPLLTKYELKTRSRRLTVAFPHQKHASALACLSCHDRTAEDLQVHGSTVLAPEECVSCHREKQGPVKERECTRCHTEPFDLPEHPEHIPFRLPHKAHSEKIFCGTCHREESHERGTHGELVVRSRRCFACHTEQKKGAQPGECVKCHGQEVAVRPNARRLVAEFPHARHTGGTATLPCERCHELPGGPAETHGRILVTPGGCLGCHQDSGHGPSLPRCETCHRVNQRQVEPASHQLAWRVRHGDAARWKDAGEHGQDCATCHRADACSTCHRVEKPQSHTGLWRARDHALAASWDRDSCKTCHEVGQCVRCHSTTKPMNHLGAWTALHGLAAQTRTNEFCMACHRPSYCMECHERNRR